MSANDYLFAAVAWLGSVAFVAAADSRGDIPAGTDCSTTDNYTTNNQYQLINLNQLLNSLPVEAMMNGGFYNVVLGNPDPTQSDPTPAPPSLSPPAPEDPHRKMDVRLVASLCSAGAVLAVVGLSVVLACLVVPRKKNKTKDMEEAGLFDDEDIDNVFENATGPKRYRYSELSIATDNFSDDNKLGEGGFGSVYRGFLRDLNLDVAIKQVSKNSKQGKKEYVSEVRIISRLRHRNLVQLMGWCHGGGNQWRIQDKI